MKDAIKQGLKYALAAIAGWLAWAASEGWITQEQGQAIVGVLEPVIDPLAAGIGAAIAFGLAQAVAGLKRWLSKGKDSGRAQGVGLLVIAAVGLATAALPSCAFRMTGDGCLLTAVTKPGEDHQVWVGPCLDGRIVGEYESPQDITVRGTYHVGSELYDITYETPAGFVRWGPKSGVQVGPLLEALQERAAEIEAEEDGEDFVKPKSGGEAPAAQPPTTAPA